MGDLHDRIVSQIPAMRCFARALMRGGDAADDLVQDCLERALTKQHLWQEGTDLKAWLFKIVYHQFVDQVRYAAHRGSAIEISAADPLLGRPGDQDARLALRDVVRALAQLPHHQRVVILLVALDGMSYETVAEVIDCPVGTVRSRLGRGRETLQRLTTGISADDPNSAKIAA
jgi:RNA polymerase sigma-70 factor, ECF subfamily